MIICWSLGGVGNQMFQYAFAHLMSQKLQHDLKFDLRDFSHRKYNNPEGFLINKIFQVEIKQANFYDYLRIFGFGLPLIKIRNIIKLSVFFKRVIGEKQFFVHDESIFKINYNNLYLYGWWQNYIVPKLSEKHLRKVFKFRNDVINYQSKKFGEDLKKINSVSIHVRLKDYVSNPEYSKMYGTCNMDYYKKSINQIKKKINNPVFFVFSDEPQKIKSMKIFKSYKVVSINENKNSWNDMYLMSLCKHNIISNSTFAWWAAWLNINKEKIVIAPKKWFVDGTKTPDLIPKEWLMI